MSVDVIIPVYKPDKKFDKLMLSLLNQSILPDSVILMNTVPENTFLDAQSLKNRIRRNLRNSKPYMTKKVDIRIVDVPQKEFDHGGTRRRAAELSKADYMLFMTQDAVPADNYLIEKMLHKLTGNITNEEVPVAAYARQLPAVNADIVEGYTRLFNYPAECRKKSLKDLETLGIKTYFFSNVCAIYDKKAYLEAGGFVKKTIFLEDSLLCAALLKKGYSVYYAADCKVVHSHNYTGEQYFKRYFDLGVSHKQYHEVFDEVPPAKEGAKLVFSTIKYLLGQRAFMGIVDLGVKSAAKLLGYKLGRIYDKLPKALVRRLSSNPGYFD